MVPLPTADADEYPDRATWLAARQLGLGSSDAAAILGVSRWHTPFTLFTEKIGLAPPPPAAQEAAEWGTLLEPLLADRYARVTQRTLYYPGPYTIQRHRGRPWQLASVDRLVLDPEKGLGVLELKTAAAGKAGEWIDEPPLAYQVQVQHQLAVTGLPWASIAVLIGGQHFRWMDVAPHPGFLEALLQAETAFWDRVCAGDAPPPDGSDATRALLSALFPQHEAGTTVALPPAAISWDAARLDAIAQLEHWDTVKNEAENQIKAAMGAAEVGIVDGVTRYTWKTTPRHGYTVAPTTVRSLRRVVTRG